MAWWNDYQDEQELTDSWQNARKRLDGYVQQYRTDPQLARSLSDWADHAPMLPRNMLLSFAKANVNPEGKLGRWAITQAAVVLDHQQSAKHNAAVKARNETQPFLNLLSDPGNVAKISTYDKEAQKQFMGMDVNEIGNLSGKQLSRLGQHKDLTAGPSWLSPGGFIHNEAQLVDKGLGEISRPVFAGLQAGAEGVQAGFRATLGAALDVADPRTAAGAPAAGNVISGGTPGQSLFARGSGIGSQQQVTMPEQHTLGPVHVSSNASDLLNPKQITMYNMLRGANAGGGLFPGGQAQHEQIQAARQSAYVQLPDGNKSALTPGRFVGAMTVEPGTKPYNIVSGLTDLGEATYADPANVALGKISDVRAARKLFTPEAAGAFHGLAKYVHGPTYTQWTDSHAGQHVMNQIAKTKSIVTLNRHLGDSFPAELLAPLQEAKTPEEVKGILAPAVLGGTQRSVPTWGIDWTKPTQNMRWAAEMPHGVLDYQDMRNNLQQVDRMARLAKLDPATTEDLMSKAARITDRTSLADFYFHDMTKPMVKNAVQIYGMEPDDAKKMFMVERNMNAAQREIALGETGNPIQIQVPPSIDGEPAGTFPVYGPHDDAQLLNRGIPLPDLEQARNIRHRMSALSRHGLTSKMWNSDAVDGMTAFGDWFMSDLWKPATLLRPAWTLRVVGEELVRQAAAGYDSLFPHPFSYLARVIGHKGMIDPASGKLFTDIGDEIANVPTSFAKAMSQRGSVGSLNVGRLGDREVLGGYAHFARDDPAQSNDYINTWGDSIMHMRASKVGRAVAQGLRDTGNADGVVDRLWDGDLQDIRKNLMTAKLWGGEGRDAVSSENLLSTKEGVQAYVNSMVERTHALTGGGDPDLLNTIVDGNRVYMTGGGNAMGKDLKAQLRQMQSDGTGPVKVAGRQKLELRKTQRNGWWDRTVTNLFNGLMTVPTNKLSRSPVFTQDYWREVEDTLQFAHPEVQRVMLDAAKTAGVKIKAPTIAGTLDFKTVDGLAKGRALDKTRELLYDASKKSNSWDSFRFLFPFGEAFKEVTKTWAKLIYDNPRIVRRGQQIVQGAEGAGIFRTDPQTGQQYFAYPFSGQLSKAITGVPINGGPAGNGLPFNMLGDPTAINMIGNGLPSVGPVVQIPVAGLLPKTPAFDWVRDFVSPYGDPNSDLFDALLPSYAKNLRKAGWLAPIGIHRSANDQRIYTNAVDVASQYLASSGKYDVNTQDGLNKLVADAKTYAQRLFLFRAMAQSVSPTAPQVVPKVKGKDGHLYELYVISDDYRNMVKENGGDWAKATLQFIDTYGKTSYLALQPKGDRKYNGLPTTDQAETWKAHNSGFAGRYPDIFGYFAPQEGDYSYKAYEKQVYRGDITPQDTGTYLRRANDRVASAQYAALRQSLPANPTNAQMDWLYAARDKLHARFPGYDPLGETTHTSRGEQISQLQKAVNDRAVKNTDLAKATKLYLGLRDQALAQAAKDRGRKLTGATTLTTNAAAPLREWLRGAAEKIMAKYPEFATTYDGILSGEVKD